MAGLIDGINPCAFAVIVFFISFLFAYKYSSRQILVIGSAYIFSVFITYLLIGMGLFKVIYSIQHIYLLHKILYKGISLFCFLLSFLSFWDYLSYRKEKDPNTQILQLPKKLKIFINRTFGLLRNRTNASILTLAIISFCVGTGVSILECACTGQIYIPVLSLLIKEKKYLLQSIFYLILYNICFILPLLLIFILALIGTSSNTLSNFLKKHLGWTKLSITILLLILGITMWGY